jgi:hypothetical protein
MLAYIIAVSRSDAPKPVAERSETTDPVTEVTTRLVPWPQRAAQVWLFKPCSKRRLGARCSLIAPSRTGRCSGGRSRVDDQVFEAASDCQLVDTAQLASAAFLTEARSAGPLSR